MKVEVNNIPIRHDGTLYKQGASFSVPAKVYETIKSHVTVLDEADEADTVTDPLEAMEPDELRAYAADRDIDLGNATSKEGILKKIKAAEPKA
ncbi:hypothetical protein P9222_00865 [Paenibacillus amylolyticus]|nr:hypothetical protein [Paenibacillus amylolyticus]WFR63034.1 hypothetical protein P9222_00865 [Paenibacillus amylolyticus]